MRGRGWTRTGRRVVMAGALAGAGLWAATAGRAAAAAGPLTQSSFALTWTAGPFSANPDDQFAPIAESSPVVATLDGGGPAAVVGDRTGWLYAYHLADGSPVAGWPFNDGGAPIDSTPSVAPLGPGGADVVFVGEGNAAAPGTGGYRAYGPGGGLRWSTQVVDPPTDTAPAQGVQASMTVAPLEGPGSTDVFAGSLDQETYALDGSTGAPLTGWPWFSADSDFSTAAAADLYGNGQTELVMGGASTAGFGLGQSYPQGGHLRILNARGGLICHYDTNQEVDSSPAVGAFLPGGATGIVAGTGSFYPGASDTATLKAFTSGCQPVWSDALDGVTSSSPALSGVLGNGALQVVEGTDRGAGGGSVWVIDAASGAVVWHQPVSGRVIGSVVTADLAGAGYQDLVVPTTHGVDVLDGRTGASIAVLGPTSGFQNAPLVTADPDGAAGITVAGYNGNNEGVIFHYTVTGSDGAAAVGPGSWPMFHHDPQLTGVERPPPLAPLSPCATPAAAHPGYDLAAADGGIFSFGEPFCGSTGGVRLARPIVGMTAIAGGGGYWLVASDGGVFAFGAAGFYGSTGGVRLAQPVVGMAATPDGRGYWLAAADGGVFAFGDAPFLGSASGQVKPAVAPVVAIAGTPDGKGYRVVTSAGRVFAFGEAQFFGGAERTRLAHPIVGLAPDVATGGYWLVASDGGVFSYAAPFLGSTGGIRLARPVVQMAATLDGGGYWLVASDGGVFSFGDAAFHGSTGGIRLAQPVVGVGGFSG